MPRRRYADTITRPRSTTPGPSFQVAPSDSGCTETNGASTAYQAGALYTLYVASRRSAGGRTPSGDSTRSRIRELSFTSPISPRAVELLNGSVSRRMRSSSQDCAARSSARWASAMPTWPAQPSPIATASVAAQTAAG